MLQNDTANQVDCRNKEKISIGEINKAARIENSNERDFVLEIPDETRPATTKELLVYINNLLDGLDCRIYEIRTLLNIDDHAVEPVTTTLLQNVILNDELGKLIERVSYETESLTKISKLIKNNLGEEVKLV